MRRACGSESWRSVRAGPMLRTRAPGMALAIAATVSKKTAAPAGCAGRPEWGRMQKGVAWVSMARRGKFMGVTASGEKAEVGLSKGPLRAARGTQISCKGWQQEAALRMLMNNLDPEVAEKPDELIVYGGA